MGKSSDIIVKYVKGGLPILLYKTGCILHFHKCILYSNIFKYWWQVLIMGEITISLLDDGEEKLRDLAENQKRSIFKQIEYLVEQKVNSSPTLNEKHFGKGSSRQQR